VDIGVALEARNLLHRGVEALLLGVLMTGEAGHDFGLFLPLHMSVEVLDALVTGGTTQLAVSSLGEIFLILRPRVTRAALQNRAGRLCRGRGGRL
jgi:hypothetical protein